MKYKILITGSNGGLAQEIIKKIKNSNHEIYRHSTTDKCDIKVDFKNTNDIKKIKNFLIEKDINCIINNSGIYSNKNITQINETEVIEIINVNLIAPILLTKMLYTNLEEKQKGGLIININSLAGKYPNYEESVYCASKFGLSGFGASISINQKKSNVKIIDCYLGAMKTKMTKTRKNHENMIKSQDVAEFIFNLLNNENNYTISSFELRNTK